MRANDSSQAGFAPHTMLDAGDTEWPVLRGLLAERLEELTIGAVLEVASLAPTHCVELLNWCRETGHDCFQMSADGDRTWFWIKKR